MNIISAPQNGQGAYGDLIYEIAGNDPLQAIETIIAGGPEGTDIVAIKSFAGQSQYEVNIAPYMRRHLNVEPCLPSANIYSLPNSCTKGRGVFIGGPVTDTLIFTAGVLSKPEGKPLTGAPLKHKIGYGEMDAVFHLLRPGNSISFEIYVDDSRYAIYSVNSPSDGIHSPKIVMPEFGTKMYVRSITRGVAEKIREYTVVPRGPRAIRLCWLNPYGALDFYTFERTDGSHVAASKSRAYTIGGHEVYESTAEVLTGMQSDHEDADTLNWLAQIINSPRVWVCESDGFRRVDVVTDRVAIPVTVPARLEFTIRDVKRSIFR